MGDADVSGVVRNRAVVGMPRSQPGRGEDLRTIAKSLRTSSMNKKVLGIHNSHT